MLEAAATGEIQPAGSAAVGRSAPQPETPDQQRRNRKAFGRLANCVALDQRVRTELLIMLAYRTTLFNFDLGTKGHNALVRGGGLGRNVVEKANAEAVALGLLERHQPGGRPGSKYRHALETLALPAPGELGQRIVRRSWFTGVLTKRELAALLYIRAAGRLLRRELAARFGWSPTTAKTVLGSLGQRALVIVSPTRTTEGAFGPTFYECITPLPVDLGAAHSGMVNGRAPETDQPGNTHSQTRGHGTPGHGKPGHVRTASQEDLSALDLATLDPAPPPPTSRSEDLAEGTPPPPASPCPSRERKISPSASKAKTTLVDWQASFRGKGDYVLPDTRQRVTNLTGWRATVVKHGGAPSHLLTPWAWRQAEHLAQHLATETTALPVDAILDAIAYWTAEAAGRGVTIRSLGLIGLALAADLASSSGSRIFDRPSNMPQARYDEASEAAAEFAQALSKCNVDVPSLTSTWSIEQLADMLARYGREAIVQGINRTTASWRAAGQSGPSDGRIVIGWRFFEKDIDDVAAGRAAPHPVLRSDRAAPPQAHQPQRPALGPADAATAMEAASAIIETLGDAGIACRRDLLASKFNIHYLADQLRHVTILEDFLGAAARYAENPPDGPLKRFDRLGPSAREIAKQRKRAEEKAFWAPIREDGTAAIEALEAAAIAVDCKRLLSPSELRDLRYRVSKDRRAMLVDAVRRYVVAPTRTAPISAWSNLRAAIEEAQRNHASGGDQ